MALLLVLATSSWGCAGESAPPRIAVASSLQQVLPHLLQGWGGEVEVSYGGSGSLQRQIELGAPVEGVVFAAEGPVVALQKRGFLEAKSSRPLATNQLVLVSGRGHPELTWAGLGELAEEQRFSMGDPGSVPAGEYGRAALEALGTWQTAREHAVFSKDVSSALALARRGEVAGAIVYATDVVPRGDFRRVDPADWDGAPRPVVLGALSPDASPTMTTLMEHLGSPEARSIWRQYGFGPPLLAAASGGTKSASRPPEDRQPEDVGFPIVLSLKIALLSLLLVGPPGIALAWLHARRHYPLRGLVDALVLLPLVLPPSVVGYCLVAFLGTRGGLGGWLDQAFAIRLIFSPAAAVVASAVVALPLVVKTAQPAIEAVSEELELVGSSLGLGALALFFRVTLPLAWRGILAGLVLAWARALGEFGATLMFAGHIPGRTNTMPLEIYAAYQRGDSDSAVLYVVVLSALSFGVVALASRFGPGRAS